MISKQSLPFKIRAAAAEDIPFIFSSWLKSFRDSGKTCDGVGNTIYYDSHHKLIQKIVQRAQVFIACDEAHPDQIIGYIAAERIQGVFVLHYVYVKHNFRKCGIGKALLNAFEHDNTAGSVCTHLNETGDRLAAKFGMIYHPYILYLDYNVEAPKVESENS